MRKILGPGGTASFGKIKVKTPGVGAKPPLKKTITKGTNKKGGY